MEERTGTIRRQAIPVIGITMLIIGIGAMAVLAADLLLLIFGAVVVAVFIRGMSDFLSARTPLKPQFSFALVLAALIMVVIFGGWLVLPIIISQFEAFIENLPDLFKKIEEFAVGLPGGRQLIREVRGLGSGGGNTLDSFMGALHLSVRGIINIVVVFITGMYLAAEPDLYTHGIVRLFPPSWRTRVGVVLALLGNTLRHFLFARLISMAAVGLLTGIGLALFGIPTAVLLGFIAGIFTFVPYAGPIAAGFPIGLAALLESPRIFISVLIFYTVVQSIEGFVITPIVQERAVTLPPALTLVAEVFMGLLFGAVGVILSVPAAALAVTFVRLVYVEGVLENRGP